MKPFKTCIKVQRQDVDALGHVNNAVYQQYLEQAAIAHSEQFGFTLDRYQSLGGVFVMRRMEMEYLHAAVAGDTLEITTWNVEMRGACAIRRYEMRRRGEKELLLTAEALWVWVDANTMRPRAIPDILQETLGDFAIIAR